MAATEQAVSASASSTPAASSGLQPIAGAPLVNCVEVEDHGKMAWMAGAGIVAGLCVAGPLGAVVGGGAMAALAARYKYQVVAVEVFPYGIQSVRMPADGIQEIDGVQYFAIDVTLTSGGEWRVMHRYNDFNQLRMELSFISWRVASRQRFAPKRWHKLEGRQLEARRAALESWLSYQLAVSNRTPGFVRRLRPFLENARGVVPALGSTYETQAALPPLPQQPLLSNPYLEVTVPAGALPGQELVVVAPDGRSIKLVVPRGATEGTMLKVIVPTTAAVAAAAATQVASSSEAATVASASSAGALSVAEAMQLLSVQIPAGVVPGEEFTVLCPDGRRIPVVLPEEAAGKGELQVKFNPVAGTATPVV